MIRSQRGFTVVELCTALMIMAIMLRVALPNYQAMVRNAKAARAISEMMVVRAAAFSYFTETGTWPPETTTGTVPPALVTYLPSRFRFTRSDYRLDWENWILPTGLPQYPAMQTMLGVSVVTTDMKFGNTVIKLLSKSNPRMTFSTSYTLIIMGLDGQ